MVFVVFQMTGLDLIFLIDNVSINGYACDLTKINCGIPQGSVLGPLLFYVYIYIHIYQAIKFCKVHHFADDANILYLDKSIETFNKLVNIDLKSLVNWLNANKISLNVKKTEMVIFKSKRKKFNDTVKIKLSGKRIYPTASVKYLGVKIDQHLTWQHHINDLSVKLNRANALLFENMKFVDDEILRRYLFCYF